MFILKIGYSLLLTNFRTHIFRIGLFLLLSPPKIFICAPYYFDVSESLSLQLLKFNIFISHVLCRSLHPPICSFKPNYPLLNSIGVIYTNLCKNYNCIYIGQTDRKLQDGINEYHRACKTQDLSSKLFQHSLNFDHPPDFSSNKNLVSNFNVLSKCLFY